MRLKSFYAKTMTEAMQMVRDTLGEDAIIVATREERGGKGVRVTAAIEPGFQPESSSRSAPAFEVGQPAPRETERDDWLQYDDEDEEAAVTEEITEALLRHSCSEDVIDQIISCATVIGFEEPRAALVAALEHIFHFEPLPERASKKPLMMIGPAGAGKTLATAKIATRGVMNGLRMGIVTTDTIRAGGVEQLESFTKLLRIPLQQADDANDLRNIVAELSLTCDQIVIDTAGVNPFDRQDIKDAAKLIGAIPVKPVLVMPGGLDAGEAGDMARAFASIGAQNIMPSRVDVARRLGGLLSAAHCGGLSFTDAGNTPKVADGLMHLTPRALSELLMPGSYAAPNSHSGSRTQASRAETSRSQNQSETRKRIKQ